ncbi:MAG: NfeD family protein [Caldisericales bacterium]|nr:NfeD family protein [Caldisericales bacterium]
MIWFTWQMWLIVALVFGIIEIATVNFYTIWLAIAAVITAILSVFGLGIPGQILAFSLISLLLVLLSEAIVRKVIFGGQQEIKTNVDALKGQEGLVTFRIDNRKGEGIVKIRGTDWSARSDNDESIPEGTIVVIQKIEGVKVIVKPKELNGLN